MINVHSLAEQVVYGEEDFYDLHTRLEEDFYDVL
jgi:hypothetical protein